MNGTVSKTEAYHTTSPNIVCGIKDDKRIDPNELPKIGKIRARLIPDMISQGIL